MPGPIPGAGNKNNRAQKVLVPGMNHDGRGNECRECQRCGSWQSGIRPYVHVGWHSFDLGTPKIRRRVPGDSISRRPEVALDHTRPHLPKFACIRGGIWVSHLPADDLLLQKASRLLGTSQPGHMPALQYVTSRSKMAQQVHILRRNSILTCGWKPTRGGMGT